MPDESPWRHTCVEDIRYVNPLDGSEQPALFWAGAGAGPRPLLVALHQWSASYEHPSGVAYAEEARQRGWALMVPDFRGPNLRPEAGGSDLAVADVLAAVDYARRNAAIDERRIYLVGASGGGHATLLTAARHPEIWAGASAWVGIANLADWHGESLCRGNRYAEMLEACCGGAPGASAAVDEQYRRRSPLTYLRPGLPTQFDINAGITDGHTGSVPISHSLRAFNALAAAADRLDEAEITAFVENMAVPVHLAEQPEDDADYAVAGKPVLFRRRSGNVRVTIFQGGHEAVVPAACNTLGRFQRS